LIQFFTALVPIPVLLKQKVTVPFRNTVILNTLVKKTFAVRGDGLGGRNQEMVLAFGLALDPLVAEGAIIKGQLLRFAMVRYRVPPIRYCGSVFGNVMLTWTVVMFCYEKL
jgi:hypothetical protein